MKKGSSVITRSHSLFPLLCIYAFSFCGEVRAGILIVTVLCVFVNNKPVLSIIRYNAHYNLDIIVLLNLPYSLDILTGTDEN